MKLKHRLVGECGVTLQVQSTEPEWPTAPKEAEQPPGPINSQFFSRPGYLWIQVFLCFKEKSKFLYNPFFLLSLLWMFSMSYSPRSQEIVQQSKILVHYFRINIMAKMTGLLMSTT